MPLPRVGAADGTRAATTVRDLCVPRTGSDRLHGALSQPGVATARGRAALRARPRDRLLPGVGPGLVVAQAGRGRARRWACGPGAGRRVRGAVRADGGGGRGVIDPVRAPRGRRGHRGADAPRTAGNERLTRRRAADDPHPRSGCPDRPRTSRIVATSAVGTAAPERPGRRLLPRRPQGSRNTTPTPPRSSVPVGSTTPNARRLFACRRANGAVSCARPGWRRPADGPMAVARPLRATNPMRGSARGRAGGHSRKEHA